MVKNTDAHCPIIDLSGEPEERGFLYGQSAATRIARGIAHYSAQILAQGVSAEDKNKVIEAFLPAIDEFDPTFEIEMRAIAEGAGVSFYDIFLLNARTEILKLASRSSTAISPFEPDGCTGVVAMPAATRDGRLLHAQTWDWKAECADTAVLLRIRQPDGLEIMTFTEAGGLARSGMNSAGICLSANYLSSDRDYQKIGIPLALIRRKILQTPHMSQAYHAAYASQKSASNNVMISHKQGVALNFECAPDETFPVQPDNDLLVHANHWQSAVALTKLRETGVQIMPDSLYRDVRVRQILEAVHGDITLETIVDALSDRFGDPWGVCRPPHPNLVSNLSATVATILMEPDAGRMSVAMLPALDGAFETHSFMVEPRH